MRKISAKVVCDTLGDYEFDVVQTASSLGVNLNEFITYIGSPAFLPHISELVLSGKSVAKLTLINLMVGQEVQASVKNAATKMFLESFDDTVENVQTIKVENLSGDELANYYADLMK